eukprot:CAMPEP_0114467430 /NCGR_PEP_ID=MMETSP0104-20121206/9614_1 /TAXON_ID=37642 ORGANISM="Paraphysomonas imperforata, Strain PA2" /NCGR_SAMPLE_ID=MMETSP0104 /ASSEMBLY_ACC=CAM_ASM_000202 /LENGTH=92 /DNA_ID=CAMNT_0001640887 /DNA_START=252 /DNA_END=526 /DNA_ORIENTATION=-
MKARRAHQRNDCDKKSSNEERDKESSNEERDKEVQKVMDQTLIREIEYILVFLGDHFCQLSDLCDKLGQQTSCLTLCCVVTTVLCCVVTTVL